MELSYTPCQNCEDRLAPSGYKCDTPRMLAHVALERTSPLDVQGRAIVVDETAAELRMLGCGYSTNELRRQID